ncbi:MAG: SpoIIE family protein phosphatase [Chloroflexi bacterium]|nr:SpoIIE family protein phosphatase [Chloroflexota bacterium]
MNSCLLATPTSAGWGPLLFLASIALAFGLCWLVSHRRSHALIAIASLSQRIYSDDADPLAMHREIAAQVASFIRPSRVILELAADSATATPQMRVADSGSTLTAGAEAVLQDSDIPIDSGSVQVYLPDLAVSGGLARGGLPAEGSAVQTRLIVEGLDYGTLTVLSPRRRAFPRRIRVMIHRLSDQVALGIHTARQHRREESTGVRLLMIAQVSRRIAAILDLDVLFTDTVQLIRDTFGYYHVSLFSVDREQREIVLEASSSQRVRQRGLIVPWGHGLIGHAARGETVLVNDVRQDPRFLSDAALDATVAELSLPVMVEDRVLGVLDLQSDRADVFGPADLATLRILADQIAVAIEDSHLYRAQQEQAWVATALLQVAEAVASQSALADITETVDRLARMLVGARQCAVLVWRPEEGSYLLPRPPTRPSSAGSEGRAFLPRQVPLVERVRLSASAAEGLAQEVGDLWEATLPPKSPVQAFPLITKGQVHGVLVAALSPTSALPAVQRTVLEGIAREAALGLDNALLLVSQREEAWVSAALLQVANVISTTSYSLAETLQMIVRLVPMLVGVPWCAILVRDPDLERYQAITSPGPQAEGQGTSEPILTAIEPTAWLRDLAQQPERVSVRAERVAELLGEPAPEYEMTMLALPLRAHKHDLGILFVSFPSSEEGPTTRRMAILTGIAGQTALAISGMRLYERSISQERMEHEMRLAGEIQASFLPERCPQIPGWDIAVEWLAARGVSGDYYDLIEFPDGRLGVSIADVSDKGVAAALYMALSRTVLRAAAHDGLGPAETLQRANDVLLQESRSGMFITLIYAIIEPTTGIVRFARAGHNPLLHVRSDGTDAWLEPAGMALGILPELFLSEGALILEPGDSLVLYTDGVTEAWDGSGEEFGMKRLCLAARASAAGHAADVIAEIHGAVKAFAGANAQSDDFTILVVKREREGEGTQTR